MDASGNMFITLYFLSNLGMNFALCLSFFCWNLPLLSCCVCLIVQSLPTLNFCSSPQDLFACVVWDICARIRLSCASCTSSYNHCIISSTNCSSSVFCIDGNSGGSSLGDCPMCSWNSVNPVNQFIVFIKSNLIHGNAWTHLFWVRATCNLRARIIVLLIFSLASSISGW